MDSIGTLDMEDTAYYQSWVFSWVFFVIIIILSALQYLFFHLYNEKYHPMAAILKESSCEGTIFIYKFEDEINLTFYV